MISGRSIRLGVVAAAALLPAALVAAPVEIGAQTRLQHCGAETCLLVTGRRSDPTAGVVIAGRDVVVQGGRVWRVALPLDAVRRWSPPFARSITVEIAGTSDLATKARLPIGLLGHDVELASLDVSARH